MSLSVATTRHMQALLSSIGRLSRNLFATSLTLLVIGLALALPLALRVFVINAELATGGFSNAVDMSVYFKTDVPLAKAQQLATDARERAEVAEVMVIPADKALDEFKTYSGFGAALDTLKENPLPHVLHVRPRADSTTPEALDRLKSYFTAWPEVDVVQVDTEWVMRFNAILDVLRQILLIATALLGAGVVAVIGNTIRLEILNRRAEIEVTKLVGGTNAFVRRPFLYAGVLYGVGAGALAWGVVAAARLALSGTVTRLAAAYGSQFSLSGPDLREFGLLLVGGILLGWLGAWIAAARQLARIEPRA